MIINYVVPILISVAFALFLIIQAFHEFKVKTETNAKSVSVVYDANSTNSGTPANEVFDAIRDSKPNYLGMVYDEH